MMNSKSRQLVLAIAITSLMLSTALLVQGASATTSAGGYIQKSLAMPAGADGRAFAVINNTYSFPSTQTVNFSNSFDLYRIPYTDPSNLVTHYVVPGPTYSTPSSFDPSIYSTGPLSGSVAVPQFLMTHNATSKVVSPTITLSARDNITLNFGVTSEVQVDAMNVVVAILTVTSAQVNQVVALIGNVTGNGVTAVLYDAYGNTLKTLTWSVGYFAYPFLANVQGIYALYISSAASSYLRITPIVVTATSLALGQFSSGEIKIPQQPINLLMNQNDYQPSQIVALSYSVSAGEAYAYSFTMTEELSSGTSSYNCYIFDVGQYKDGTPVEGILCSSGTTTVEPSVSWASISGTIYIVLVADYISRFYYSMGVEPTTLPQAPLNTRFSVVLPTPFGMHSQWYMFSVPSESMVRMNYTCGSPANMYADVGKFTPSGTQYWAGYYALSSASSWIRPGLAETNFQYQFYMDRGNYSIYFYSGAGDSALIEINAYPIQNYTLDASNHGTPISMTVHSTTALAINIPTSFNPYAFNVTMLSQLNASMLYQMTLFDNWNRLIRRTLADGSTAAGIGDRESGGHWLGISGGPFYVDPSGSPTLSFIGNTTTQASNFIPTYAGRYFIVFDFLNGYNTTTSGLTNLNRWRYYLGLTLSIRIDLSKPSLAYYSATDMKIVSLDTTSGSGSTQVVLTTNGVNVILLNLTDKVYTWTRISVSTINGSRWTWETVIDRIRFDDTVGTFDRSDALGFWPAPKTVTNTWGKDNQTYILEFGTVMPTTEIGFYIVEETAAHTIVSFNVQHFNTTAFFGLGAVSVTPAVAPGGISSTVVLVIIIAVVAVVVIIVIYLIVRKRSK